MSLRFASLLALVVMSGCDLPFGGSSHGRLTGVFVLRTVNGAPLPAVANREFPKDVMGVSTIADTVRFVADTIRLYEDGYGTEVRVVAHRAGQDVISSNLQVSETGRVSFHIGYPCNAGPLGSCPAAPYRSGVFTEKGLTIDSSESYRTPLEFERVWPSHD